MEQKLIFLDIDGTLTEPGKNIPPASAVEAVCRARKNGHKVVLCSGRNYGLLSPLLQFGFDGFISSAGGYIEYGGHIVYEWSPRACLWGAPVASDGIAASPLWSGPACR